MWRSLGRSRAINRWHRGGGSVQSRISDQDAEDSGWRCIESDTSPDTEMPSSPPAGARLLSAPANADTWKPLIKCGSFDQLPCNASAYNIMGANRAPCTHNSWRRQQITKLGKSLLAFQILHSDKVCTFSHKTENILTRPFFGPWRPDGRKGNRFWGGREKREKMTEEGEKRREKPTVRRFQIRSAISPDKCSQLKITCQRERRSTWSGDNNNNTHKIYAKRCANSSRNTARVAPVEN